MSLEETLDELQGLAAQLVTGLTEMAQGPGPGPVPHLLTFDQVGDALSVSRTTVQELVDDGELPVVSVTGRAVRVDVRDIEAYIKTRRARRG